MKRFRPGELRLVVLGDVLREPMSRPPAIARRLGVSNPDTVRVTLERMEQRGWVRQHREGFMLTRTGSDYLATVREWIAE